MSRFPFEVTSRRLPKPRSAWLLFGDDESYLTKEEMATHNLAPHASSESSLPCWTCCPHIEIGDKLLIYFIKPRKAIHFVATACSRPYLNRDLYVNSLRPVDPHQWWIDYTGIVEVEPIAFRAICDACGETLVLKGRSGKPIRAGAANRLLDQMRVSYSVAEWCTTLAYQRIVGRSDLPRPEEISLGMLTEIPSSLLKLESGVEEFIVEPLLRLADIKPPHHVIVRRYRIGRKVADYAILQGREVLCIIEVKLRVGFNRDYEWAQCPDLDQASGYAAQLRVPFMIIDCDQVFCFRIGGTTPYLEFERQLLQKKDIAAIRAHISGHT